MISFKLIILLASLAPTIAPPHMAYSEVAAAPPPVAAEVADLEDQLEKGLRARRPREFAFIARVVAFVEQDKLPLKLVKETFDWAREKKPYPFQYFERAMRLRAAKIGVDL